jgi:hypothetical protein
VTLTEPVAALLLWSAPLTTPMSSGSRATVLASRPPAVTDTRPFLLDPREAEQSVDVCDAQVVASQALWPTRPDIVWTTSAMLAPSTLTCSRIDPAARFDPCARPSPILSTVQPDETLPINAAVVRASCLLPASPCPARHASNVSELHLVASQAVAAPARPDGLASNSPKPRPYTVTRVEPVAAALTGRPPLTLAVSAEYTPVPLPI